MASGSRKTGVLLGFVDEKITEAHEKYIDFTTNKIGGAPNWILRHGIDFPVVSKCPLCDSSLSLILQLFAPLELEVSWNRTFYVFACLQKLCWNKLASWKCIRIQEAFTSIKKPSVRESNYEWISGSGDWSDDENGNVLNENLLSLLSIDDHDFMKDTNANTSSGAAADDLCEIATAEIEDEVEDNITLDSSYNDHSTIISTYFSNVVDNDFMERYTGDLMSYFLIVDEEICDDDGMISLTDHERKLLRDYQSKEIEEKKSEGIDDVYEKSIPRHGDILFHDFLSVLRRHPGQVIRYARDSNANPLFLRKPEGILPKRCVHCSGSLVFEFQILPTLIPFLHLKTEFVMSQSSILEFGTIIVLTCEKSCWDGSVPFMNELLILQAENV